MKATPSLIKVNGLVYRLAAEMAPVPTATPDEPLDINNIIGNLMGLIQQVEDLAAKGYPVPHPDSVKSLVRLLERAMHTVAEGQAFLLDPRHKPIPIVHIIQDTESKIRRWTIEQAILQREQEATEKAHGIQEREVRPWSDRWQSLKYRTKPPETKVTQERAPGPQLVEWSAGKDKKPAPPKKVKFKGAVYTLASFERIPYDEPISPDVWARAIEVLRRYIRAGEAWVAAGRPLDGDLYKRFEEAEAPYHEMANAIFHAKKTPEQTKEWSAVSHEEAAKARMGLEPTG